MPENHGSNHGVKGGGGAGEGGKSIYLLNLITHTSCGHLAYNNYK